MLVESMLPFHPSADARGHAHPFTATTAIAADNKESQNLAALLAKVAFDVKLRGLAASPHTSAHEMYHPRLRKSDMTQQGAAVSHLDTVSCWREISYIQALELTVWERLFHYCLVSRIEDHLQHNIVTQLNKRKDRIDESTLLPCLIQSFPKDSPCLLDINLSCFFCDMTDALCDDHHSHITARNFPWSFGSGDLPRFVYNFLSTQDCFQNTPAGPCVYVKCSIDWFAFPWVPVTADVAWHPPAVEFQHVPTQIRPGARYVIVPYRERDSEDPQQSAYKQYPELTEYIVKKSNSKVQWDHRAKLLRVQAPERVGIKDAPVSETIIQVKTITRFPDNVRFESISRYAVEVDLIDIVEFDMGTDDNRLRSSSTVAPCALPRRCSYLFEPSSCQQVEQVVQTASCAKPTFSADSLSEALARQMPPLSGDQHLEEFAESAEIVVPMHKRYYPNSDVGEKSTKKRSNSLCESKTPSPEGKCLHRSYSSDPFAELKRRKLDQTDVSEMEGLFCNRPGRAMDIQCPTPPYTPLTPNSNDSDHQARFISPIDMQASPARYTRTGFRFPSQLSQQTIQRNYDEFQRMALRKLIEEPYLGDMGLEKIFLGDSEAEDWHSSDLEGLSDEGNDVEREL